MVGLPGIAGGGAFLPDDLGGAKGAEAEGCPVLFMVFPVLEEALEVGELALVAVDLEGVLAETIELDADPTAIVGEPAEISIGAEEEGIGQGGGTAHEGGLPQFPFGVVAGDLVGGDVEGLEKGFSGEVTTFGATTN